MIYTTLSRKISIFIAIVTSFVIVACGGGSGGGSRGTPISSPSPPLTINVQTSTLSVAEESGTIQYTLSLSANLDRRVVVNYEAISGTAQSGEDFIAQKGTATIDIGKSATFAVTIINDDVVEQNEQFSIELSDLKVYEMQDGEFKLDNNSALRIPTGKLAPITIRDNDLAEIRIVSYTPETRRIGEGEELVIKVVSDEVIEVRNDGGESGLKLNYKLMLDGAEIVPSSDFIISGDRIAVGETSTDLKIRAIADGKSEGLETFEFGLTEIDRQKQRELFGRDDVVRIDDNKGEITVLDRLAVGFVTTKQEALENSRGNINFQVSILNENATYNSAINLNVKTSIRGGSAEAEDIKNLGQVVKTVTIVEGETSVYFLMEVTDLIVNDSTVELSESFFLELEEGVNFNSDDLAISTEQNRNQVEILNDDTAILRFEANNTLEIREGEEGELQVMSAVEGDLGLRYTVGGTAQAGVDYESLSGITNSGNIVIQTKLDSDVESPETIDLTLSGVSSEYKIGASNTNALSISATDATAQVRITDIPIVSIAPNQIINEAKPQLQIITSATIDSEITVNVSIENNPAKISGEDLIADQVVEWTMPANATSDEINLSSIIINDDIVELDETINIVITKRGSSDKFAVNSDAANNRVAVTLSSEDRATLDIIADDRDQTVNEGENIEIVIESSNPIDIGEDLVIAYSDERIRATRNTDYSFNVANITIKKEATSGRLVFESKFDSILEATEGVRLQIDTIQNSVLIGQYADYVKISDNSISTITIRDRNTLRLVTNTVTEQAGIVELTLELDRAVDSTTEVVYRVIVGTAGELDFDATNGTAILKAGESSGTFGIAIKDDEIVEKTETFEVRLINLGSTDAAGNAITPSPVTIASERNEVEIIDNDEAKISISPSSLEIGEGDSTSITIETNRQIIENITINYQVTGTATAGEDYIALTSQAILQKDTTSVTINLAIANDGVIESNETVIVTLTGVANIAGYRENAITIDQAKNRSAVTIVDNIGTVKLSIESLTGTSEASINEGDLVTESLTFVVKADKPLSESVNIAFRVITKEGSAKDLQASAPDFVQTLINSSISGGNTKELSVNINGDTRVERDETFDIVLEQIIEVPGAEATIDSDKSKLTVTIKDNDKAEFQFVADETTGVEGGKINLEVSTVSVIEDIEIELTTIATVDNVAGIYNQAVAADYQNITGILTFSDATRTGQIEYQIVDDNIVELAERFLVLLSGEKVKTRIAVVNIEVDSKDTTKLMLNSATQLEGNTGNSNELTLRAELTNPISAPISFSYRTENSTGLSAARGGVSLSGGTQTDPIDYIIIAIKTATISDSNSTGITIEINPDKTVESNEAFRVVLSDLILGNYYDVSQVSFVDGRDSATATIQNDDTAVFTFKGPANVTEGDSVSKSITFRLESTNDIANSITFSAEVRTTERGTAKSNDNDFISKTSPNLSLTSSNNFTYDFNVTVNGDNIVEADETLEVSATVNPNVQAGVLLEVANNSADATIVNDDRAMISIAVLNSPITEPAAATAPANFRITSNNPIANALTINYALSGTATQNDDYNAPAVNQVTLAANTTTANIPIAIKKDNILENDETLIVTLSNTNFPEDVSLGNASATATIRNNDENKPTVSISPTSTTITEGADAIFTVSITPVQSVDYNFGYEVTAGNVPISNNDLTGTTLGTRIARMIPKNTDSTTITIRTEDDNIAELNEGFNLTIYDSVANTVNLPSIAQVTIIDNDLGEISNATATTPNDRLVNLSWTTTPANSVFAGVTIAQATGTTAPNSCSGGMEIDSTTTTSKTIAPLTENTSYSFRICARANDGRLSSGVALNNIIPYAPRDTNRNRLIEIGNANDINTIVRNNLNGTSDDCINCIGFEVTQWITLGGIANWDPIGTSGYVFSAIFEGNGNIINALTINRPTWDNVGLFRDIRDATISNLRLTNVNVTGRHRTGALVGQAVNSYISNISTASGSVTGARNTGGLIGIIENGTIINSHTIHTVSSVNDFNNVGGLVGYLNEGTVRQSWATGNITGSGTGSNRGGLVGHIYLGTVKQSWAAGNVAGNGSGYGGLVGSLNGPSTTISNSWARGNVTGTNTGSDYGGLVGYIREGTITNTWAAGTVTGGSNRGGLVGFKDSDGNINGSNYRVFNVRGNDVPLTNSIFNTITELSQRSGDGGTGSSNWHAGLDRDGSGGIDLDTRFCDTDNSGIIEEDEQIVTNTVWTMPGGGRDVGAPTGYHWIPAIRCIGNTEGIINSTEIDRQRRLFPL